MLIRLTKRDSKEALNKIINRANELLSKTGGWDRKDSNEYDRLEALLKKAGITRRMGYKFSILR